MERDTFETMVFTALAASGKSEAETFIKALPPEMRKWLHIGEEVVILDDFKYVNMLQSVIDQALAKIGEDYLFFTGPKGMLLEPHITWKLFLALLMQDYQQIIIDRKPWNLDTPKPVRDFLSRIDRARRQLGAKPLFFTPDGAPFLGVNKYQELETRIQPAVEKLVREINDLIPADPNNATIFVEFARGGEYGQDLAEMPYGYADSFTALHPHILQTAGFLYLKVTPDQAAYKNFMRANPTDPSSFLEHMVPYEVMFKCYGGDDFWHLMRAADIQGLERSPSYIDVLTGGRRHAVPAIILDNTHDLTSFVRECKGQPFQSWPQDKKEALFQALKTACEQLWERRNNLPRAKVLEEVLATPPL